jgi:NAD(P)-dependent dehydrogenase (short-subunit alcohol dehydrogenase family)
MRGRSAIVTGAGRGLGRAIALQLAEAGVNVALVARSRDELAETAKGVQELGGHALVIAADLGRHDDLDLVLGRASAEFGVIDILINNAGTLGPIGSSVAIDYNRWAAAINVNLVAPAYLTFALLPAMVGQRWGRIVNISSGVAVDHAELRGANAYTASKSALEAHTVSLGAELAGTGVSANAFRPGPVDTAMQEWFRTADPADIGREMQLRFIHDFEHGRLISPSVSAQWLLADLGSRGEATGEIWEVPGQEQSERVARRTRSGPHGGGYRSAPDQDQGLGNLPGGELRTCKGDRCVAYCDRATGLMTSRLLTFCGRSPGRVRLSSR